MTSSSASIAAARASIRATANGDGGTSDASKFQYMAFALDRLFGKAAPYRATEMTVVLAVIRAMGFDSDAGGHVCFLSYEGISRRTRLAVRTVAGILERHCEHSPAPLLARSFAKMTRGKIHRSYRWTLVTSPELFALKRDLQARREKRPPSGAAAAKRAKPASETGIALEAAEAVSKPNYKTGPCSACGEIIVTYNDGTVITFVTDKPHTCQGRGRLPDRQTLHTSERQNLPTKTSELAKRFGQGAK